MSLILFTNLFVLVRVLTWWRPLTDTMSGSPTRQLNQKLGEAVSALRMKRRDLTRDLQTIEKRLLRSFDLGGKEQIINLAIEHAQTKQVLEMAKKASGLIDRIKQDASDFLKEDYGGNEHVANEYKELCSFKSVLTVKELDNLIAAKPPKGEVKQAEVEGLQEKDSQAYIRKFAENKGSTQGMAERLQQLFPPPKTKPITSVEKKE